MNGFFSIHRDSLDFLLRRFRPKNRLVAYAVWIELLKRANWEPGYHDGKWLERGQVLIGRNEMAEWLGVDPQRIRTVLLTFLDLSELTIKSTNQGTTVTIVNYDSYCPAQNKTNQQNNQQLTSNQPATNQQLTTPNKGIREEVNKKDLLPGGVLSTQSAAHEGAEEKVPPPPAAKNGNVKFTKDNSTPLLRTEAELLDFLPNYDHSAVYQHYLTMKRRYHRTRFLDPQIDQALKVLARDPDIMPRLTQEDMMALVEKWMQWGSPWHAADLWKEDEKRHCAWWETLVFTGNHRPKFEVKPNADDELTLGQWLQQEAKNAKTKSNPSQPASTPENPGDLLPLLRGNVEERPGDL